MKLFLRALPALPFLLVPIALNDGVEAADVARGLDLSAQCKVCHGPSGDAVNPLVPKLAGQNELYLLKALTDFQSDKRTTDKTMVIITKKLSQTDLEDLAAYYASIAIEISASD